jgi:hypothetical protein
MMERQPCMSPILEALLRSGMGSASLCCPGPAPNTSKINERLQLPTALVNRLMSQLITVIKPLATKVVTVTVCYCT